MIRDRAEREQPEGRAIPPRLDPRAGRPTTGSDRGAKGRGSSRAALAGRILGATLSVVLLATSGWGWYLGQVAEASVNRTDAIPTSGNDDTSHTGADMNLLLVGDDSRDDLSAAQMEQLNAGDDGGSMNTDTMMLLHVPADGKKASFVSFPRDSYVQIPGHGSDKLNAAYADGYNSAPKGADKATKESAGQQLLVQTISQLTGLQIDHYVSVDLLGFYNLSTVVGGVEVNLCYAVDDRQYSGAHFPAGVQTISGADALKFVRERHGVRPDGSLALPRADLDREVRQQVFIAGVVRKMVSDKVLLNPAKQQQLVKAAATSLTVDQSLDLMQLAEQMRAVQAGGVSFQTLPVVGDGKSPSGADILKLPSTATLHQWFANLSATTSSSPTGSAATSSAPAKKTVAPSSVKVQVFNGSGTPGLAAGTATSLKAAGYTVTGTGNADSAAYAATEIRYAAGDDALAATLAASVPGATTTQITGATPGTVQLILGKNFNGIGQAVTPVPTTPSSPATPTPRTAADTSCIN